jgi:hypothetical protein
VLYTHNLKLGSVLSRKSSKSISIEESIKRYSKFILKLNESVLGNEFKNLLDISSWKKKIPKTYTKEDFLNSQNYWFSLYTKEKHIPYRNGVIYFIIKLLAKLVLLSNQNHNSLCCAVENDTKNVPCVLGGLISNVKSCLLIISLALAKIQDQLKIDLRLH